MSATTLALFITIAVLVFFAVCFVVSRASDVKIARITGFDPRLDRQASRDAADQIAARKRHPSAGNPQED